MVAPNRNPLAGLVEVDETEIACRSKHGPVTGGGGRCHQSKIIVVGAVEVKDGGPGRIRLAEVPNYSAGSLHPFRTKLAGGPHVLPRLRWLRRSPAQLADRRGSVGDALKG